MSPGCFLKGQHRWSRMLISCIFLSSLFTRWGSYHPILHIWQLRPWESNNFSQGWLICRRARLQTKVLWLWLLLFFPLVYCSILLVVIEVNAIKWLMSIYKQTECTGKSCDLKVLKDTGKYHFILLVAVLYWHSCLLNVGIYIYHLSNCVFQQEDELIYSLLEVVIKSISLSSLQFFFFFLVLPCMPCLAVTIFIFVFIFLALGFELKTFTLIYIIFKFWDRNSLKY